MRLGSEGDPLNTEVPMAHFLSIAFAFLPFLQLQDKEQKPDPPFSPFERMAKNAILEPLRFAAIYRVYPAFEVMNYAPNRQDVVYLREFPDKLIRALQSDKGVDRKAAAEFLLYFALLNRAAAWERDLNESKEIVRVALGKYAKPCRGILEKLVTDKDGQLAFFAGATLLTLVPGDPQSIKAVVTELGVKDEDRKKLGCYFVGVLHLK
jgi:hypothetical protein